MNGNWDMNESIITNKQALLEHIHRDWTAINQFLDRLSDVQWTQIKNADDWSIKDHVAHLSAWENSVIAFLTGKPRYEGLGIPQDVYLSDDVDAMNDVVFKAHQHDSLDEVQSNFAATHQTLMRHIKLLSDEDLHKPYVNFLPDEPGDGDGSSAMTVIYSNSASHYREHQLWMQDMLNLS